jgi:glucose-6-phosphate isomerase
MKMAAEPTYEDNLASLALLKDYDLINRAGALANHFKDADMLIVIGIGGSNLGTMAVAEACLGKHYQLRNTPQVLFADTVDPNYSQEIVSLLQHAIDAKKHIVINAVSKSGTTTETVVLLTLLIEAIKQVPDYRDHVVITTDKGSKLWHTAKQEGFHILEIPAKVGGRYSVFSPVGLFPLALLGIDIQEMIKGAVYAMSYCMQDNKKNPAALGAIALWHYNKKGINIHDTFVFSQQLECVGKWYRQLLAESCGKENTLKGKKVNAGITPTVSVGSVDLHSMGQLYIDGPSDKITTFINVEKQTDLFIPNNKNLALLVDNIQGRQMKEVMDAILGGTLKAYEQQKIPHMQITLPTIDEKTIGELLQMKMLETIYLGALLEINPFDQPAVEKYKVETRKLLAGK